MNKAMSQLTATVGQDVPTLAEVRDKIEARYAKAIGTAELQGATVETRMLEVERAAQDTEAVAKLAQIKEQLGIASPAEAAPSISESATEATPDA
jgi:phage shock protein A